MKNILIIGGTSGIGNAVAHELNGKNQLFITGRSQKNLETVDCTFIAWKASEPFANIELPEVIHGIIYCPGTINLKPINRLTEADFLADYQVNTIGAFKVIQAVLPRLRKAKGASVVLFSTVASNTGMPFHASIAAAKGGLQSMALSLAAELASSQIRVNVVAPSLTNTPLAHNLLADERRLEAAKKRHPLGNIGSPDGIASLVTLLLSDKAAFITGQIMGVDGGIGNLKV